MSYENEKNMMMKPRVNEILKMFGRLKSRLYKQNLLLPDADIFIAATAYVKAVKLITGNTKHFQRFTNLAIENWM